MTTQAWMLSSGDVAGPPAVLRHPPAPDGGSHETQSSWTTLTLTEVLGDLLSHWRGWTTLAGVEGDDFASEVVDGGRPVC